MTRPTPSRPWFQPGFCHRKRPSFWAAFFNFIAFLFFGLHVAQTMGTGLSSATVVDSRVIFGALSARNRLEFGDVVGRDPI